MKRILIFVVMGVVVAAGVVAVLNAVFSAREHTVGRVMRGPAKETVYATGFVEALNRRVIRSPRAAVIGAVFKRADGTVLREGDEVSQGQPILRLRDTGLEARKSAAQSELDRIATQLKDGSPYRKGFELRIGEAAQAARDERAREQRLAQQLPGGGLSQDQYDAARTRAITAEEHEKSLREDYQQALANLESGQKTASATLEQVNGQEKDDLIVSPLSGVILRLPLEEGEFAASGAELAMVGDIRELIIEAEVNEDDIGRVKAGQRVDLRLAGNGRAAAKGTIFEILPDADRATKGYIVKVRFSESSFVAQAGSMMRGATELPGSLQPMSGMTAELAVIVDSRDNTLIFPRAALTADNTVFVVKDGIARETSVKLGLVNFSSCEALGGLAEGDLVVTSDLRSAKDGARIKAKEQP